MYNYSWFYLLPGFEDGSVLEPLHVGHDEAVGAYAIPTAWLVFAIIAVFALMARAGLNKAIAKGGNQQYVPDTGLGPRNAGEMLVDGLLSFAENVLNSRDLATRYFPLFGSVFTYILVSNLLGLVPGFLASTGVISTNMAVALVVFVMFNYAGIKEIGLKAYLAHMAGPMLALAPFIFAVELFSVLLRPMTLSVRLYINMFADHLLLGVSSYLTHGILAPAFFVGLGAFVSFVQAFVFMLLTVVYIALAVGDGDHH
ncbi:MAG: F0F1 ATP synthase subunit A [Myxococcota bacterium]|nr:F0F1 ATP synthase subunit A [Myxococcota bacterium]